MSVAPRALVAGSVAPGFEPMRAAFERNFSDRGELGGAVAVFVDGKSVVDLWGGYIDGGRKRPWLEDTIVLVFSTTKGLAAAAVAVAHSRGLFEYEEPVSRYWPEFAENGKDNVTVRQLLAHQAGLCALDIQLDAEKIADWGFLTDALARQRPLWEPGRRHGYHSFTLGWCESELIHRVDPQRRRLTAFFTDEGRAASRSRLPFRPDRGHRADARGDDRWLARLEDAFPPARASAEDGARLPEPAVPHCPHDGKPAPRQPGGLGLRGISPPRDACGHRLRKRARNCLHLRRTRYGGTRLGLRPSTLEEITGPPLPPADGAYDLVLHTPTSYAFGWWRPSPRFPFGSASAFGAPGMGGSFGYADPATGVGFAYVTNRMGYHVWDDARDRALRIALWHCLEGTS